MPRPFTANADADAAGRAAAAAREQRNGGVRLVELARAAARGDERAISALYRGRFDLVFDAARRASRRDEHFCLDAVQETFVRVLRARAALGALADDEHVDRWLVRVTQTVVLDMLRAERRRVRRESRASREPKGGSDPAQADERLRELERELAGLPERDRELLRLRSTGATLGMIAEMMGSTIGSVHGRLRRTIAGLSRARSEVDHE